MTTDLPGSIPASWLTHPLFTSVFLVVAFSTYHYTRQQAMLIKAVPILSVVVPMNFITDVGVR